MLLVQPSPSGPPWKPGRTNEDECVHIRAAQTSLKKDEGKVRIGNCLLYHSIRVIRHCVAHGIPVSLENSRTSWMWKVPALTNVLNHALVTHTVLQVGNAVA